jgi:acyl-CoA synthetase (AMP-forming)/AMP-acid ligase II
VRIVDDGGEELPRGEPGEVVIRGYNVMSGYFEDPEQTDETIDADGWLHTGDIAVMDERGYIDITDRKKDMFIQGGFNAYPAEIESLLLDHPDIAQVAVIGVPDEKWGETVKALVVLVPGAEVSDRELIEHCRAHLAHYKCPTSVEVRDELTRTATGKLQKFKLREPYWEGRDRQIN